MRYPWGENPSQLLIHRTKIIPDRLQIQMGNEIINGLEENIGQIDNGD